MAFNLASSVRSSLQGDMQNQNINAASSETAAETTRDEPASTTVQVWRAEVVPEVTVGDVAEEVAYILNPDLKVMVSPTLSCAIEPTGSFKNLEAAQLNVDHPF